MNMSKRLKTGSPPREPCIKVEASTTKDEEYPKMIQYLKTENKKICQDTLARASSTDLLITEEIQSNLELSNNLIATNKHINYLIDNLKRLEKRNTDEVTYLQEARLHLEKVQKKKSEHVNRIKDIEIKSELAENCSSLGSVMDELENINKKVRDLDDNLQVALQKLRQTQHTIEKEYPKYRENIDKIVSFASFEEEETEGVLKRAYLDLALMLPQHITVDDIREMREPLKRRLEEGKVFARHMRENNKQEQQQQLMIGQLRITQDKELILHHLTETESIPPDSHVLEYSDLIKNVDPSCYLTFIDFGIGRVFFSLYPDTEAAKQFFLMCSGEMGISYATGVRLITVAYKAKFEGSGGQNERLRINVGETLLKLNWEKELQKVEYVRPCDAGVLYAYYKSEVDNGFGIYTKGVPNAKLDRVFGKVYKALDVVERLCSIKGAPRNACLEFIGCQIKDCGLVIQLP